MKLLIKYRIRDMVSKQKTVLCFNCVDYIGTANCSLKRIRNFGTCLVDTCASNIIDSVMMVSLVVNKSQTDRLLQLVLKGEWILDLRRNSYVLYYG